MAKNQLYDHCEVVTDIDKEKNLVNVQISFKEHVTGTASKTRLRYTSNDIQKALQTRGVPVAECVAGLYDTLDNRTEQYHSGGYVFSLVAKQPAPKKTAKTTKPTSSASKNTRTNTTKVKTEK